MSHTCRFFTPAEDSEGEEAADFDYVDRFEYPVCTNPLITQGRALVACGMMHDMTECIGYEPDPVITLRSASFVNTSTDLDDELERQQRLVLQRIRSGSGFPQYLIGVSSISSQNRDGSDITFGKPVIVHSISFSDHGDETDFVANKLYDGEINERRNSGDIKDISVISDSENSYVMAVTR
jgi:hypothetical protein